MLKQLGNGLKSWLTSKSDPDQLIALMTAGNIGILSARCCNPAAATVDEQLRQVVEEALTRAGITREVRFETITGAQKSLRAATDRLDERQQRLVQKLMALFQIKGLGLFPVLLFDGEIAFYSGVPTVEQAVARFTELQSAKAA